MILTKETLSAGPNIGTGEGVSPLRLLHRAVAARDDRGVDHRTHGAGLFRSEEHTSELQSH